MSEVYKHYTSKQRFFEEYVSYQERYRQEPRESDKVIAGIVGDLLRDGSIAADARMLDIGCSSGNLLRLLRTVFPQARLSGMDLSQTSVDSCKAAADLAGIEFARRDLLDLGLARSHDVIVLNAVSYIFEWDEFRRALTNCHAALAPGGALIVFDWFSPFRHQHLRITETSVGHPEGMTYNVRPIPAVADLLAEIGFGETAFHPFDLPIDLPPQDVDGELISYTLRREEGGRLCFRGALYQPWCHVVARRPAVAAR